MPVIKRYPNRKLYDTEAKRYITLAGITDLIRQGAEVQIIDHTSKEDLTAVTLTQIILEQEKKQGGFLPKSVLTSLVQAGGETVGNLRRGLASPLGLLRHVDEEIETRLQNLINRGELAREEGNRLRDKLLARSSKLGEDDLERFLHRRGIPTRDELQKLHDKLDALSVKLSQMTKETKSD
jgi:polyhydroxyalkanoate synthesis repressor PhaR